MSGRGTIIDRLKSGPVLLDGGMGSMLIAEGLPSGTAPERWVLERPEAVRRVHEAYIEAGADVVQTCTFGGSRLKLAAEGLEERADEVNRRAAELAAAACPEGCFVSGNVGPSGQLLAPLGPLDPGEAEEAFAAQAGVLAPAGVSMFSLETFYQLEEAAAALRGVRRTSDLPVLVSMTFDRKPRGFFTLMGDTPVSVAASLEALGADMLGANCTLTSEEMIDLAGELRQATRLPLVIQPNAGKPELDPTTGLPSYGHVDPDRFAEDMIRILEMGVEAVGGCCGTDPRFIAGIRRRLKERDSVREN